MKTFSVLVCLGVLLVSLGYCSNAPLAEASLTVSGTSNIYGAGHSVPPAPAGHGAGILPTMAPIPSDASVVMFPKVFGEVRLDPTAPWLGPDGEVRLPGQGIQINSYGGISGIVDMDRLFFLAGVFLDDSEPTDPAPARLNFTGVEDFESISPQLRQTFFVGDGLTGTGSGNLQKFNVPAGATRLFLGFHDKSGPGDQPPGWYFDNSGAHSVEVVPFGAPRQPDPRTFPDPPPSDDADNVVFMVHGWKDSKALFTTPRDDEEASLGNTNMAANIQKELEKNGNTDWDVRTYDWRDAAALNTVERAAEFLAELLGLPAPPPSPRAKIAAWTEGHRLAYQIWSDPNYNKDTDANVHLIAHSLGGLVIDVAARVLERAGWNGKVHLTFLDAYTPGGWEDSFGEKATWAEHYYHRQGIGDDYIGNTSDDFNFAYNVDITALLDDPGTNPENHDWPVRWYDSTIEENGGFGFPTSMTENLSPSGEWKSPIDYTYSADTLVRSNMQYVNPVDQIINTSPTGTIDSSSGQVTLGTGSAVWINLELTTDDVTNFLEFDFEYTEDADGLLSVYLDDELLGLFYERFTLDGQQNSGKLFFEDDLEVGFHLLAFRVDPLTDSTSFVTLSGIEAGYMTIVPEPSTLVMLLGLGGLALAAQARRRRKWTA